VKTITISLFLLASSAALADPPADGFYLISKEASAPSVMTQDGQKRSLGRKVEFNAPQTRIFSGDNANTQFWFTIVVPRELYVETSGYVLVVANRGYLQAGSGRSPDVYSLDFRLSGAEDALAVSRYLNAEIAYHRHPGHQLLVSFTAAKASFRIGDDVPVTFRIKNVGANTVAFSKGGAYRGASRDNQYSFSARLWSRQVQDIGSSNHFGGLSGMIVLKPGEVFEDHVDLKKWFAFDQPGRYEVLGSYSMGYSDPDGEAFRAIWSDYVTNAFEVTIDK
jgi:hypothetical protein